MESWQILRVVVERVGAKTLAAKLRISTALVYKWCQEPAGPGVPASGALNPLDRVATIVQMAGDPQIVNWLCHAANGFYVANPHAEGGNRAADLLGSTQKVVEEFSNVLSTISQSIENDGQITREEAARIRESWEELKSGGESFVNACERGFYLNQPGPQKRIQG